MVLEIRVGHTPDADDAFMFYAIENESSQWETLRLYTR